MQKQLPKKVTLFFISEVLKESKINVVFLEGVRKITVGFKSPDFFIDLEIYTNSSFNYYHKDDMSLDLFETILNIKSTSVSPSISILDKSGTLLKCSEIPLKYIKELINDQPESKNSGYRIYR